MASASIAHFQADGTVRDIFVYSEGQPEWLGNILLSYYDDAEKVKALIDKGDVYELEQDFDATSFYGKKCLKYKSLSDFNINVWNREVDYVYLFNEYLNSGWKFTDKHLVDDVSLKGFMKLTDLRWPGE